MKHPTIYDHDGYPRAWAVLTGAAGLIAAPYALMWLAVQAAHFIGTI